MLDNLQHTAGLVGCASKTWIPGELHGSRQEADGSWRMFRQKRKELLWFQHVCSGRCIPRTNKKFHHHSGFLKWSIKQVICVGGMAGIEPKSNPCQVKRLDSAFALPIKQRGLYKEFQVLCWNHGGCFVCEMNGTWWPRRKTCQQREFQDDLWTMTQTNLVFHLYTAKKKRFHEVQIHLWASWFGRGRMKEVKWTTFQKSTGFWMWHCLFKDCDMCCIIQSLATAHTWFHWI